MVKPGPKPKPIEEKRLAGNPGGRALDEERQGPVSAAARVPHGLSRGAKKFWRKNALERIEMGILRVSDIPAFMLMAEHWNVALQAAQRVEKEGLTTTDEHRCIRKSPLLQVFRDNSTAYRLYASEFGMTPSARTRVRAQPAEEQMSLAELLFSEVTGENVTVGDG